MPLCRTTASELQTDYFYSLRIMSESVLGAVGCLGKARRNVKRHSVSDENRVHFMDIQESSRTSVCTVVVPM